MGGPGVGGGDRSASGPAADSGAIAYTRGMHRHLVRPHCAGRAVSSRSPCSSRCAGCWLRPTPSWCARLPRTAKSGSPRPSPRSPAPSPRSWSRRTAAGSSSRLVGGHDHRHGRRRSRRRPPAWSRSTRPRRSSPGDYEVQWTTFRRRRRTSRPGPARSRWQSRRSPPPALGARRRRPPTPIAAPRHRRPLRAADASVRGRPTPPVGRRHDRRGPPARATSSSRSSSPLIVLGAGAAYLLTPAHRRRPRDPRLASAGSRRAAVGGCSGCRRSCRPAVALAPPAQRDLHEPAAAGRLPGRAPRSRSPCRSCSCIVRDVRAAPPDLTGGRSACRRPGCATGPARDRAHRLGLDHRPGHRRRVERRRRRDAVPVGLRLGRRRADLSALARPGLAVARPVLHAPRHRRVGPAAARRRAAGTVADYPDAARSLAGGRSASRSSSGSSSSLAAGAVDPVRRARRLHRAHARDDGPVRARRVAGAGRDVHGLVPAARPARAVRASPTRTGAGRAPPVRRAACSSRAGPRPT